MTHSSAYRRQIRLEALGQVWVIGVRELPMPVTKRREAQPFMKYRGGGERGGTQLIPAFRKQRQANFWDFKARLVYRTEQPRLLSEAPARGDREAEGPTILLLTKDQHRGSRAAGLHSSSHRGAKKPY